jgi:serine protease AprX
VFELMSRHGFQPLRRTLSTSLLALVLLLVQIIGAVPAAGATAEESRVFPPLLEEAIAEPAKLFRVIITRQEAGDDFEAGDVQGAGGRWLKQLPHDALVVELPGRVIRRLGQHRAVKYIAPDAPIVNTCAGCTTIDPSRLAPLFTKATGAASLWPASTDGAGWTGKGVGVAVLDTGINRNRRDWNDADGNSRIVRAPIFSSDHLRREDRHGHGTHVAGIIGGNSLHRKSLKTQGKYIGVAPDATLIDVKVADERGASYTSDLVMAIEWVIANRETHNIRVMNLSLVSSVAESYKTSTLAAAVERAWFSGILVVVAAGNAGAGTLAYPPANDPFVITVGASDTMNTVANGDDTVAPWSSYGTTQDGFSKPEVVAPGRMIVAPLTSASSVLGLALPGRIVDGSYMWLSGTSMAAPVVAGVAALAFQAHPEWTNDQVKWLLMQTATPLGLAGDSTPLPGSGSGTVNAPAVVEYAGTPQLANQGIAISEQLIGPDGALVYDNSSWSSSSWSSSSWSSSSWSSSSWSSSSWSSSWQPSNQAVHCGEACDVRAGDRLLPGTHIPFEDPAVELGLPSESDVVAQ